MPSIMSIDPKMFPQDDAEAARRFLRWREEDPFPEIPPALLNTADLLDYIATTGMIWPFEVDRDNLTETLKPASCSIALLGRYVWWEDKPDDPRLGLRNGDLSRNEELVLERNSIVYVTLEPTFRLPDYIAGRFNLSIPDVYRGLLVGTGPLVDPGFQGKLSVPLHNLTSNDYVLRGGEALVWMEFTKLSPNALWQRKEIAEGDREKAERPSRRGQYVPFPKRKLRRRAVDDYLREADPRPIRSSIPELVGRSQRAAEQSGKRAEEAETQARRFFNVSIGAAVIILLTSAAVLVGVWTLIVDVRGDANQARDRVDQLQQRLESQQDLIVRQGELIRRLQQRKP